MSVKPPTHQLMITSNKIKLFFPYFFLTSFSQFLFIYLFIYFFALCISFSWLSMSNEISHRNIFESVTGLAYDFSLMKRKQENQVETCHYFDDFHFDARKVRHILPVRHIMEQCRRYLVRSWGPYFHIFFGRFVSKLKESCLLVSMCLITSPALWFHQHSPGFRTIQMSLMKNSRFVALL